MDDDQQAELEMHLAAGTDLPTALAAVQRDVESPRVSILGFKAAWVGMAIGAGLFFLWLLLLK